jgi:hypothetical protein
MQFERFRGIRYTGPQQLAEVVLGELYFLSAETIKRLTQAQLSDSTNPKR